MDKINDLLIGENSERAFRQIVSTYQKKVIRFISLFVQNEQECEELASDVFLSIWTNRCNLGDISNFDNYIFIISRNKALNHLRKDKVETIDLNSFPIDAFQNTETTPESIFINREMADELNTIINELPHKTKLAFHLVREDKMKYKDAAEVLGVSIRTIEKQVASAVTKLKERLS